MTTPELAVPRPGTFRFPADAGRVRALLETEVFSILVIATWASILAITMRLLVIQDTFLALVDGRLIAQHGLPHIDTLTYWTLGRRWIDQQWGAHLALYEVGRFGGVRAVALVGIACVVAALAAAAVATRKLGASPRSAAIGLLLPLVCSSWVAEVRTQSLALVPFVVVYALLALDARRPSRRVLFVLPTLVVWANLHGSVALAAGLTTLYGLTLLRYRDARGRAAALVFGAPLCALVSPYGLDLLGYYRLMLLHPPLASFVVEWKPPAVQLTTAPLFASAFVATALWARHHRTLTSFERWAILILLAGAMTAIRNAVWFELAAVVSLPRLVDAAWPSRIALTAGLRRVNLFLGTFAVVVASLVIAAQFAHPVAAFDYGRSPAAAKAVAAAAGSHGIVLADDEHADWLLWQQPSLAGRVAYDVRFELFDRRELQQIVSLQKGIRPTWRRCGATASVVTFSGPGQARLIDQQDELAPGARPIVRTPGISAVAQPPSASTCRRL